MYMGSKYIYICTYACVYIYIYIYIWEERVMVSLQEFECSKVVCRVLYYIATHRNTLQYIETHSNSLQPTVTPCNTLERWCAPEGSILH